MRRVRYGMVGGGPGAFIGAVHRAAASLDGEAELVAGAFSASLEKSRRQGAELGLDETRVYGSYQEMVHSEAAMPADERIELVSVVTPNHLHHDVARTFLVNGFHVVCDKPLTTTVPDAEALCRLASEHERVLAVTYNYTGYPMIKEARARVRAGQIGTVRKVIVEYSQGWLSTLVEATGQKQAAWRQDPSRAGISSALGDIGSHAYHLLGYVTGLRTERLLADVSTIVPGRVMEDDANLLLHLEGGARAVLIASQVSLGEENGLSLRVYGSEASLIWHQEDPNRLLLHVRDEPTRILSRGNAYLSAATGHAARLPPGHPEGFIEAFANIYRGVCRFIRLKAAGGNPDQLDMDFPTAVDGVAGVHFIHRAIESGRAERWLDLNPGGAAK